MNRPLLTFVILLLPCLACISQQKFLEKVEIGIHIGPSIPVGVFSKSAVEPSLDLDFNPENQYREFRGFVKKEGGQAQLGSSIGASLKYNLFPSFYTSINYSFFNNSINVEPQETYFETHLQDRINSFGNEYQIFGSLTTENYQANSWYVGLGYFKDWHEWSIYGNGFIGITSLAFPFYTWSFENPGGSTTLRRPYPLLDPLPDKLSSILLGIGLGAKKNISEKIGFSLEFKYLRSDHPHEYFVTTLVGSSGYYIEDSIHFRVVSTEIGAFYKLISK